MNDKELDMRQLKQEINGIHVEYSKVNQAWFLMWFTKILRILPTQKEALYEMRELIQEVGKIDTDSQRII